MAGARAFDDARWPDEEGLGDCFLCGKPIDPVTHAGRWGYYEVTDSPALPDRQQLPLWHRLRAALGLSPLLKQARPFSGVTLVKLPIHLPCLDLRDVFDSAVEFHVAVDAFSRSARRQISAR